jgi:hypothetical protein
MKYTASLATWHNNQWHLDPTTETSQMNEQEVIAAGHAFAGINMVIYREYENDIAGRAMIEYNGHLEPAFAKMVA